MNRDDKQALLITGLWTFGSLVTNIYWCLAFSITCLPYWMYRGYELLKGKRR